MHALWEPTPTPGIDLRWCRAVGNDIPPRAIDRAGSPRSRHCRRTSAPVRWGSSFGPVAEIAMAPSLGELGDPADRPAGRSPGRLRPGKRYPTPSLTPWYFRHEHLFLDRLWFGGF